MVGAVRATSALGAVMLVVASGCAPGERGTEDVARSYQSLTLGPTATFATSAVDAEAVATDTGYALAYVTHVGSQYKAYLAYLDGTGALEDGPREIDAANWEIDVYGVAWDGARSLVVAHTETIFSPQYVDGFFVAKGAPPTTAFTRSETQINDNPAMSDSRTFGRPVFHGGVFWVSGMYYGGGENPSCLGGTDTETAGGYRFDGGLQNGAVTTTTCGLAVTGPGAPGTCLSRYKFHDDCTPPDQIQLRVDTLPPGAFAVASTPPFIPRRAAAHDDVIVALGDATALALSPAGAVVGAPPITPAPESDIGWVVDRFVVVTGKTGAIHGVTLDPAGTSAVDPEAQLVPTGTMPFLAPRQDGTALLGYFVGEELKLGILEVTTASPTSSASSSGSASASSSDSASASTGSSSNSATSGAGVTTTTTGSGGNSGGAGGAPDDGGGGSDGCSTSHLSVSDTSIPTVIALGLLALGVRRRGRPRNGDSSSAS